MSRQAASEAVLVYVGVLFIMALSTVIVPVLDVLAREPFWSSVLFSAYSVGALVSLIPFGVLTDRYGASRVLVLSFVLTTASGVGLLVFSDLSLLVAVRFVEGLGCGAFFPPALSLLSAHSDYGKRAVVFSFLMNGGFAAGSIAGGALAHLAVKGGIYLFTIPLLLITLYALIASSERGTYPARQSYGRSFAKALGTSFRLFFSKELSPLWVMCIVVFGATGAVVALYPFYTVQSLTKLTQGVAIGSIYMGGMLASPVVGYIRRLSVSQLLKGGAAITALGILTTIFTPVGLLIFGLGGGFVFIGAVVYLSQMARSTMSTARGLLMGTLSTMVYIGFAVVPPLSGSLHPTLSLVQIIALNALIVLAAATIPLTIRSEESAKSA